MEELNKDNHSFIDDESRWGVYGPFAEAQIKRSDVKEIVHCWSSQEERGWDGEEILAVFTTVDNRWGFFEASCDYTGWDCQAGASEVVYASSLAELIPEMTAEARRVFGYEETPDCNV